MAANNQTVVYDVEDAKVWPVSTDATSASPTFGSAVDVRGIQSVSMDPNITSAELKGDGGTLIDFKSRIDRMNLTAQYGFLDLDVLAVITGQTVTGATDKVLNVDRQELPKFKFGFQIIDVSDGVGSVNVEFYICRVSGLSFLSQQTDAFGTPSFDITAFNPANSATPMGTITHYEAETALT